MWRLRCPRGHRWGLFPLSAASLLSSWSCTVNRRNAFGRLRLRRCLLKTQVGHRPTHSLAHPIDRATNGEATPIPDPTFNGSTATTPPLDPLGLGGRGWGAPPTPPTTHGAAATRTPPTPGGCRNPGPQDAHGLPPLAARPAALKCCRIFGSRVGSRCPAWSHAVSFVVSRGALESRHT